MMSVLVASAASAYDWLQFGGDAAHSALNIAESRINTSTVASLAQQYVVTLPATVDGAPVFLDNSSIALGGKDLLFFTTRDGRILAYDRFGAQVWAKQFGPGSCKINNGGTTCYTTSSPAIDPNRQYVYTYGLDGYVHKLQVADGAEILGGGWPQLTTTKPYDEKGSSALAIATSGGTSWLYVVHSGYPGDNGDYQGHVTAINLSTGAQNVFNAACSNIAQHLQHLGGGVSPTCSTPQNGIWARAGVIYDAETDRIFLSTGNGAYNANSGGFNWSESIIALHPDATGGSGANAGKPLDAYTPTNYQSLDNADADIGSTAPAILPVPPDSTLSHLAVQGGKDALLRLLNLGNLSGQGGPGHVGGEIGPVLNVPQGGGVFSQPAVWVNPVDSSTWVFVVNGNGASALRLALGPSGIPTLLPQWQNSLSGTSPIVANGVLFFIAGSSLRALNPLTGSTLWSAARGGGTHWQSLIIANSVLYATDASNNLVAFGLTMEQPIPNLTITTTALASSMNPVPIGALLTLTATVRRGTPTGTVAFLDGDAPVPGCSAVALSSAAAVCNVSTLPAGLHRLVATYSGDNSYAGSTSAMLLQSVDASAEFFTGTISSRVVNARIESR